MKRALVISKFWYPRGGAEIVALGHARILRDRGVDVSEFATAHRQNLPSADSEFFPKAVDFDDATLAASTRMLYSRSVVSRLRQLVRLRRPEVAIVHNIYHHLGGIVFAELARMGVPIVHMLHDYKPVCPQWTAFRGDQPCFACKGGKFYSAVRHGCGGSRPRSVALAAEAYWQWRILRSYQCVDVYAAPSRFLADRYRDFGFPFAIEYLPNFVAALADREGVAVAEADRAEREDHPILGFAGRLSEEKGVDLFVSAARSIPNVRFRVAGDGPLRDRLQGSSPANIEWLGWLSASELRREMERWTLSVVPSRGYENAPMAVLEAMSVGVPVVVTPRGGGSELAAGACVVAEASTAALVSAIENLLADPPRLAAMGIEGRRRARERFSQSAVASRLEELCREARRRHVSK